MPKFKSICIVCGKKTHNSDRCPEHRVCEICGAKIPKGKYCSEHRTVQKRARWEAYQKYYYRALPIKKPEMIERKCLKCDKKFIAQGRFNRICPRCTVINSYKIDPVYAYGQARK